MLTYHVVPGKDLSAAIAKMIKDDGGTDSIKTVSGHSLKASMSGGNLILTDDNGGAAKVTIADVQQSNGVIHVIDSLLLPK